MGYADRKCCVGKTENERVLRPLKCTTYINFIIAIPTSLIFLNMKNSCYIFFDIFRRRKIVRQNKHYCKYKYAVHFTTGIN